MNGEDSKPWYRMPDEPNRWYQRFKAFCRLGSNRSVLHLYNLELAEKGRKKSTKLPGAWNKALKTWLWLERAEAFDDFIDARTDRAWEKKRQQHRRKELELSSLLIEKAEQMLQFPLATTTRETSAKGGVTVNVTTIEATRWALRDAATLVKVADELARLGLGMDTNQVKTRLGLDEGGKDASEYSDEQLKNIIAAAALAIGPEDNGAGDRP